MTAQPLKNPPSIMIAIPSVRDWKLGFANSMIQLSAYLGQLLQIQAISNLAIHSQVSSLLPLGREMLLNKAIDEGFTHILFIDDDTAFPLDAFKSLWSHNDLDYVAANFCKKKFPLEFTACGLNGQYVNSQGKTGVEQVQHVGLGMSLIKTKCFKDFPEPRFSVLWWEEAKTYMGEDTFLCNGLAERGFKFYVDHDCSNMIGHIGDYEYGFAALEKIKKEAA